ncbi:hypothetical protein [Streptomyces sp. ISL-94]|uniref:hypothetical protein n=1 Tax=Streptomyces sp. ISL-94 TaxID=2819190 RepID=UPI0020361843|nr:hypothetical protein [Streptomyces sp. ISL-94]
MCGQAVAAAVELGDGERDPLLYAGGEDPVLQGAEQAEEALEPALFTRLLRPLGAGGDGELVAALVQLCDGAIAAAQLDKSLTSAKTAKATAELLLASRRPRGAA